MKQTIAGERVGELFAGIVGDPEGNPIMGTLSDSAIRDEKGNMENYKYYNDNNFVSSYRISSSSSTGCGSAGTCACRNWPK